MKLNRLILDNFLTYEHLDYSFVDRPLMVQGINLTDELQKSNGSGKSGMATGIEFCITAQNSRDVRDIELVTYGEKEANAELFASCDVRKESLHIKWTIKVKGSNLLELKISKNGGEYQDISFSNINDGKKAILDWFAISKEDLFSYYIINKSRFKSFFKSSNKEKVDLINRFSDASIIEGLEKIDNSKLQEEFEQAEFDVARIVGKIELLQESLSLEVNRDLDSDFLEETEALSRDIYDCKDYKKDIGLDLRDEQEFKSKIENELKKAQKLLTSEKEILSKESKIVDDFKVVDNSTKILQAKDNIKLLQEEIQMFADSENEYVEKKNKIKKLISSIDVKLAGQIDCPKCEHGFVLDGDISTLKTQKQSATKLLERVDEKILEYRKNFNLKEVEEDNQRSYVRELKDEEQNSLSEKRSLMNILQGFESNVRRAQSSVDSHNSKLRENSESISKIKSKLIDLESTLKSKEDELKNLKPKDNRDAIKKLELDIDNEKLTKAKYEKLRSEIGDKIYERNQWITNFKQFRGYLANQSLEIIEFHCNRYLHDMGSDLKVKLEGFKTLANGSIKDEITAKVVRGVDRSFSSFSGGERGRLLFASILANRHMINQTHPYGGLDYLCIDEIFEGVDSLGLKHLLKSARSLEISAHIITHVSDEDVSDDILTIVKENGKSTIKNN